MRKMDTVNSLTQIQKLDFVGGLIPRLERMKIGWHKGPQLRNVQGTRERTI